MASAPLEEAPAALSAGTRAPDGTGYQAATGTVTPSVGPSRSRKSDRYATGEGEGREPDLPRARFDTDTDVGEANARAELVRPTMPLSATDVEVAVTRRVERKADRPSAMPLLTVAIGALSCG